MHVVHRLKLRSLILFWILPTCRWVVFIRSHVSFIIMYESTKPTIVFTWKATRGNSTHLAPVA